jgi:hypothetical protein
VPNSPALGSVVFMALVIKLKPTVQLADKKGKWAMIVGHGHADHQ